MLATASCTATNKALHHRRAHADAAAPLTAGGACWARKDQVADEAPRTADLGPQHQQCLRASARELRVSCLLATLCNLQGGPIDLDGARLRVTRPCERGHQGRTISGFRGPAMVQLQQLRGKFGVFPDECSRLKILGVVCLAVRRCGILLDSDHQIQKAKGVPQRYWKSGHRTPKNHAECIFYSVGLGNACQIVPCLSCNANLTTLSGI